MNIASALRKLRGADQASAVAPVAPTVASGAFEHDREARPAWVALLRDVSPLTELHGTLEYVWEPGDPWTPGQRWMVYETIAAEAANYELVLALRGPNPRLTGHMCTARSVPGQFACLCKVKLEGWRQEDGDQSPVTLGMWKLFQRTGRVGRPFLVVQGSKGGHKAFLTRQEIMYLEAAGKKTYMPAIGELAYAEPDNRTLDQIVRFNRLRQMAVGIRDYKQRMGKGYALELAKAEKELRRQLVEYLDDSLNDNSEGPSVNELFLQAANDGEMDAHAPRTDVDWEKVGEQGIDSYLETGHLIHPSNVK